MAPDDLSCKTLAHCLSLRDKSDVNCLQSVYALCKLNFSD